MPMHDHRGSLVLDSFDSCPQSHFFSTFSSLFICSKKPTLPTVALDNADSQASARVEAEALAVEILAAVPPSA